MTDSTERALEVAKAIRDGDYTDEQARAWTRLVTKPRELGAVLVALLEAVQAAKMVRSQSYDGDAYPTLTKRLQAMDEAVKRVEALLSSKGGRG